MKISPSKSNECFIYSCCIVFVRRSACTGSEEVADIYMYNHSCQKPGIVAVNIFKDNDNHFSMKVAIYLLINNTKTQENWQAFI